jgi:alcohol dehydrogenase
MIDVPPSFLHSFRPGDVHFGRGAVSGLGDALADRGCEGALVVCGSTVGESEAVMEPIRTGLGDRLAGIFAETTPGKSIRTAFAGVERMGEVGADALVGVGGGSSLDTATAMAALHARGASLEEVRKEVAERGGIAAPDDVGVTLVHVPTTLAGADLTAGAGISVETPDGERVGTGMSAESLLADAVVHDPDLFGTTPIDVLAGSAMNGFDKGIEAPYSRNATAITDATASHGLRLHREALPELRTSDDPGVMERAVAGNVLTQYGVSTPGGSKMSVIHAFGHALRKRCGVQQGVAHAVMAPHTLRFVFERIDGRRALLADALGVESDDPDRQTEGVVEVVIEVRDGLALPDRLRELDGVSRSDLPHVAELTAADPFVHNGPEDLDPTVEEYESVLEAAW